MMIFIFIDFFVSNIGGSLVNNEIKKNFKQIKNFQVFIQVGMKSSKMF